MGSIVISVKIPISAYKDCGISRKKFLEIIKEKCKEKGMDIEIIEGTEE